tara:strand:- start:2255 stop:3427 length:1173 start_codon:yes stop_codon:yes gene_type:complete
MKKFLISILLLLTFKTMSSLADDKMNIYYSGFSFSNMYESNSSLSGFSSKLIKEIDSNTGIDIISSSLLKTVRNSNFLNISLNTENLLDFSNYPSNAIVMSVSLQHEEFTQEFNFSTNIYNGFYDAYFQILFYDFTDQNLIASIPFDFEIQMLSEKQLDKKEVLQRIKKFYLNDNPFVDLENIINDFNIKIKYESRIGVTKVEIMERAFEEMPTNAKIQINSYKNLIAQTFSKRLSKHHNIAFVPFVEGQAIGKTMKLRFVETDKIYSIKLPNPDYHVYINLKGFKKVLAKTSDIENLFLYGSFFEIKIFQPDIDEIYFNETLRGVTKIKVPKDQVDVNDWRKYYYNMEILFNNFSTNITKSDKKWLKEVSKNKIKKSLKSLNSVIEKVK